MPVVQLPRSLVDLFPGAERRVELDATSVDEVVAELERRWPGMRDRLCDSSSTLRAYIHIYVDGERAGLETPVAPTSVVLVLPAVAGGSGRSPR